MRNCRFLLASLVALLVAFPFLEDVARPLILILFYLISILDPSSFVTIAALGYGDITPYSNIVRSPAALEVLAGILYIVAFMPQLVSLRPERAE